MDKDLFNETFRPFCGLNTKDIFVKKPTQQIQNSQISDFKVKFASRTIMREKLSVKKKNYQ